MSSSAFFIEAAANTVRLLSCARAGGKGDPHRMPRLKKSPARRRIVALRACLRAAVRARKSGVGRGGMRQAEAPFRQSGGFTIRPDIASQAYNIIGVRKRLCAVSRNAGKPCAFGSRHDQSTAIMTSDAFTTTVTLSFALMPNSSTDSLVIDEVTVWPLPISTRTCEVVAPFLTSMTVPLIWLRALMRMMALTKLQEILAYVYAEWNQPRCIGGYGLAS